MTVIVASLAGPALAQDAAPPPASPEAQPAPPAPPPPPPAPPPEVTALQNRLDALEQRTQALEAERARLLSQPAPAPRTAAAFTADESGFSLTSADRLYQFRLKGQFQVDGRRFFDDTALGVNDTFLVRRARPIIAGTLFGLTDFYLAPDFGNNTIALYDAYLDTHPWPWLRLRVGKFKGPVGLERLQSDSDLVFVERALDSNLSSQREVGFELWGDIAGGVVRWEAAMFNGNPDNGLNDIDNNHAKSFGGRLFIQPFAPEQLRFAGRLGVGIAASTGNEKGSATTPWLNPFKSPGQQTIFSYLSATPATTVFAQGRHTRINPQLYYYFASFGLLAEWVKEYQELANSVGTGAVNNNAAHATASFVIGGDATYEGVKPHHPLSLAAHTFGALEIALRYEYLHIDSDAFPAAADPSKSVHQAQSGGVALNWQLTRNIKASLDYIQTWFEGGAPKGADRATEKVGTA
ncbi:MAG TPA: porin, partial [Polyangia bacterium]|nr:porin [Polyangia bacterium]